MALRPQAQDRHGDIAAAVAEVEAALQQLQHAGVDKILVSVFNRHMNAVASSARAFANHSFSVGNNDVKITKNLIKAIDTARSNAKFFYRREFTGDNQNRYVNNVEEAFDDLVEECAFVILERFSYYKLFLPRRLRLEESTKYLIDHLVEAMELNSHSMDEKTVLWREICQAVEERIGLRTALGSDPQRPPNAKSPKSPTAGAAPDSGPRRPESKVPEAAPNGELYPSHAQDDEDVVGFLDRVYGQAGYLTGEFTRADLRKIDPSAVEALENWEKKTATRPKRRAPLNLPTLKELNDRLLQADPATLTHAERLAQKRLIAMRKQGAKRSTEKLKLNR